MENTIDSILENFEAMAERKGSLDANVWLTGCAKIVALIGAEQDRFYELEHQVASKKNNLMVIPEMTSSKAKIVAEAMPEFLESKKLKAKIDRCFEMVRIGKIMARMSQEEYKSN